MHNTVSGLSGKWRHLRFISPHTGQGLWRRVGIGLLIAHPQTASKSKSQNYPHELSPWKKYAPRAAKKKEMLT